MGWTGDGGLFKIRGVNDARTAASDFLTVNLTSGAVTISGALTVGSCSGCGGGWVDDGTVVRLQTSTDNVGIGTTSPEKALHVKTTGDKVAVFEDDDNPIIVLKESLLEGEVSPMPTFAPHMLFATGSTLGLLE